MQKPSTFRIQNPDIATIAKSTGKILLAGVETNFLLIKNEQLQELAFSIDEAPIIGVWGAGRSGQVGKAFVVRMKNLGYRIFFIGEPASEPLIEGYLLIIISGSGETPSSKALAESAKKIKVKIAALTSNLNSSIGQIADHIVRIGGRKELEDNKDYLSRIITGENTIDRALLNTFFEVTALITLDSLATGIKEAKKMTNDQVKKGHATIE